MSDKSFFEPRSAMSRAFRWLAVQETTTVPLRATRSIWIGSGSDSLLRT